MPPWRVMQWLPLCEVAAALRVAWSWWLDSEHYFRVFAERHRSLASGAGCGSLYFKWEDRALCHMQMQRFGRLTEFQKQVFSYYEFYGGNSRFVPIGEVIDAVRLVVRDATAEQVKTAVANLVSVHRVEASTTGKCHRADFRVEGLDGEFTPLQQRVLNYYTTHATSDEGLAINAVAAGLRIPVAQLRTALTFLQSEMWVYSTIDDDHHKSIFAE